MARPAFAGSDNPSDTASRHQREPQERQRTPIGTTESIRLRLGMNKEHFSEALGFHPSTYAGYLQKGMITKTGALAAEALLRRQQASGESADEVFILRLVKGAPMTTRLEGLKRMSFDGKEYLLVPIDPD